MNAKNEKIKDGIMKQDVAYVLKFGKHKGKTIAEVAISDINYLKWYHGTITKGECYNDGYKAGLYNVIDFILSGRESDVLKKLNTIEVNTKDFKISSSKFDKEKLQQFIDDLGKIEISKLLVYYTWRDEEKLAEEIKNYILSKCEKIIYAKIQNK